jgi:hypothetical protein
MVPPINPSETCSEYWDRLSDADKEELQAIQRDSGIASMTLWLLRRGCMLANPQTRPVRTAYVPKAPTLNQLLNANIRRRAASAL